ncbi:MAG: glycosyltransferase family 2 protein, partial [bacterium]
MSSTFLSVIIPTKNRTKDLVLTLRSVFAQTRQPDEIVIVDQSHSNDTQCTVNDLIDELQIQTNIIYILDSRIGGLSQAKNKGFEHCQGSYILILDDDLTMPPNYIETCLSKIQNTTWLDGIAGYRVVPGERGVNFKLIVLALFYLGPFRYYFQTMRIMLKPPKSKTNNPLHKLNVIGGGWYLIKREVLEDFKFDENLTGPSIGEDQDFFIRASSKFNFALTTDTHVIHRKTQANSYYVNRIKNENHHECKVIAMGYLFKKNLQRSFIDNFCYAWLCIGLILDAVLSSVNS